MSVLDPALLVMNCSDTPLRAHSGTALSHDWTPNHQLAIVFRYPSGQRSPTIPQSSPGSWRHSKA